MPIPIDFSGKSVLITGGSQGIGEAMARRFHAAGATVIINFHGSTNTAADALRLTQDLSQRIDAIPADVSRPEEVEKMMETIRAKYGGLDFLVNNAAILRDRTIAKMSLDEWQSVIDVNLSGVFYCCKFGLPIMRDHGAIVSIGSIAGLVGFFGQANYAAAKAGVMSLMRVISREAARHNIRANAIAPGVIETSMSALIPDEVRMEMLKNVPLNRFGRPEEIADAAVFLCSDLASYITGQTIEINGGWRG